VGRALSVLSGKATVLEQRVSDPEDLAQLRGVLESQAIAGWRIEGTGCTAEGERVTCRYRMDDEMLRKCGLALVGTHRDIITDGKLDSATRQLDQASRSKVYSALDRSAHGCRRTIPSRSTSSGPTGTPPPTRLLIAPER
jgi:hypothetical protein